MGEGEEKGEMKNKEGRVSKGERDIEIEGRSVSGRSRATGKRGREEEEGGKR